MHLHGFSFRVLRRNGTAVPHNQWADTVLLAPELNHYIQHSLTLQGRKLTIQQLAIHTRLTELEIMDRIGRTGKQLWEIQEDGNTNASGALKMHLLRNALEATEAAQKQASVLENQQNGQYVPFLTSALNQAITNLINSGKPMLELLKAITPPVPRTAIQINAQGGNKAEVPAEKAIGANEAIMLINQQREGITLLENPEAKMALYNQYILPESLPEVIATKQQGSQIELQANIYTPSKVKKHESRNELTGTFIPLPK
jgi:hypothetical protein